MSRRSYFNIAIIFTLFIFLSVLMTACSGSKAEVNIKANNEAETQPVTVTTAQAVVHQIPTYFEATGSLASDAQTDVAPTVGGKIVAVNFDLGSYVNRGDALVKLDDRDARI